MKIDKPIHPVRPQGLEQGKQTSRPEQPAGAGNTSPASVTQLNRAIADSSGDIDQARVDEIRQAISEGKLSMNADRIADGLIDSVRALLDEQGEK